MGIPLSRPLEESEGQTDQSLSSVLSLHAFQSALNAATCAADKDEAFGLSHVTDV